MITRISRIDVDEDSDENRLVSLKKYKPNQKIKK